jgi:hypothetical protein
MLPVRKAAKAARVGPCNRPPHSRSRSRGPDPRCNCFGRHNCLGRPSGAKLDRANGAFPLNPKSRLQLAPLPGDIQLGTCFSYGAYGHLISLPKCRRKTWQALFGHVLGCSLRGSLFSRPCGYLFRLLCTTIVFPLFICS